MTASAERSASVGPCISMLLRSSTLLALPRPREDSHGLSSAGRRRQADPASKTTTRHDAVFPKLQAPAASFAGADAKGAGPQAASGHQRARGAAHHLDHVTGGLRNEPCRQQERGRCTSRAAHGFEVGSRLAKRPTTEGPASVATVGTGPRSRQIDRPCMDAGPAGSLDRDVLPRGLPCASRCRRASSATGIEILPPKPGAGSAPHAPFRAPNTTTLPWPSM